MQQSIFSRMSITMNPLIRVVNRLHFRRDCLIILQKIFQVPIGIKSNRISKSKDSSLAAPLTVNSINWIITIKLIFSKICLLILEVESIMQQHNKVPILDISKNHKFKEIQMHQRSNRNQRLAQHASKHKICNLLRKKLIY